MLENITARVGYAMSALGALLALLTSQTTIFGRPTEPTVVGLGSGFLMLAGVVVSVVALKRRAS